MRNRLTPCLCGIRFVTAVVIGLSILPWTGAGGAASAQTVSEFVAEAYACPPSTQPDIADVTLCTDSLIGVTFTLEQNGLQLPQADFSDSNAWYGGVPIGDARMIATAPEGFAYAEAYCSTGSGDTLVYPATASPPYFAIDISLPEVPFYRCVWYFTIGSAQVGESPTPTPETAIPVETAVGSEPALDYVSMTVYACPDGMPPEESVEFIVAECTLPAQGIPYYLESEPDLYALTDAYGYVQWQKPQDQGGEIEVGFNNEYVELRYLQCATYPSNERPANYLPWNGGTPDQADEIAYPTEPGTSLDCIAYVQPLGSRLEFQTWECTNAFDREGDLNDYRSDPTICQPRADWTVRADRELEDGSTEEVNLPSRASVVDWPTGRVTFGLNAPDYQQYVHCELGDWDQYADQSWGDKPAPPGDLRHDLHPGDMLACEWFAVPLNGEPLPTYVPDETADNGEGVIDVTATPEGYGRVRFVKYECPEDPGMTYEDLYASCLNTMAGVTYDVYRDGTPEMEITTDDSGYGETGEIPTGLIGLAERIPSIGQAWYPRVFCVDYLPGSGGPGPLNEYLITEPNMVMLDLRPGYNFICEWFNLPVAADGSPPAQNGQNYGSVVIHKYMCGLFNVPDMTLESLTALCNNNISGAGFNFHLASGQQSVTTQQDGLAEFSSVPSGEVVIEEQLGATGYQAWAVFCDQYQAGGFPTGVEAMSLGGTADRPAISTTLSDGYVLECFWFNRPDPDAGFPLVVVKYMCPIGYDPPLASSESRTAECRREYGTELLVTNTSGYASTAYTGTDGFAYWEDIPYGEIQIAERESANYRMEWARCSVYPRVGSPGELETTTTDGVRIGLSVSPASAVYCDVYNVWTGSPEDYVVGYGLVVINKYDCPADGAIYPGPDDNIVAECIAQRYDVPFRAFRTDSSIEPIDFGSGYSSPPIPSGPIAIGEAAPDGYRVHRVFCVEFPNQTSPPPKSEVAVTETESGFYIETSIRAGYVILCDWYNRPYRIDETPIYEPTYYPTPDGGFTGADDYTPTYTVEAPYDYTPTSTYEAEYTPTYAETPEYTPTYPPDYTPTYPPDYTPTYPPDYTPTYEATVADQPTYTATIGGGAPPIDPTYTPTREVTGDVQPTASPTAAIVIVKWECPAGYDPTAEETDPELDCAEEPDETEFRLLSHQEEIDRQQVSKEDQGYLVTFDDLDPGVYAIEERSETALMGAFVGRCDSNLREFGDYAFLPYALVNADGQVAIRLLEGEELVCHWYNIPKGEGQVEIYVLVCPGRTANPARCDPADVEIDVELVPVSDGESVSGVTDLDGFLSLTVPAGTYEVETDGDPACLVDSEAADDIGNLIVEPDGVVDAFVYRCGNS